MTRKAYPRAAALIAVLLCAGAGLAGCATTGAAPTSAAPTTAKPAKPTRGYGQMAPIPNPTDDQPAKPRPAAPAPGAAPPAARPPAASRPAAPAPAPRPALGANTQRAAQLRAQGLEQLNRGAIDRAVALLQQAQQLDPGNALIKRDLQRAQRISQAVRAK